MGHVLRSLRRPGGALLRLRRGTPFARNSTVWTGQNPYVDIGDRSAPVAYSGNAGLVLSEGSPVARHTTTTGADALTFGSPSGIDNGFAGVIRFKLENSSQTTIFNSLNEATTSGATHLRTNGTNLQFVSRDAAVRFTSSGVVLRVGRWHTVAFRQGVFPPETAGRSGGAMWIDGKAVGRWDTASTTPLVNGVFAVACGRYASDSAQSQPHQVSLAAFAFDSASDADLLEASADPFAFIFGNPRIFVPMGAASFLPRSALLGVG